MRSSFTIQDLEAKKKAGTIRGYSVIGAVPGKKKSKYGNKKVEYDGHVFDSKKEATYYFDLKSRQMAGEISDLKLQVVFQLSVCKYIADFEYKKNGRTYVIDVKSPITRKQSTYRLKKKLMKAELGIEIIEV